MALYTPRHFASRDDEHAREIIRDHPFATLVTTVDGADPQVTHLPMLLEENVLWGHVAKPNPQWQMFAQGRTVAVFHGPHQYISPRWYEKPELNVPTWNYAVVHVHGRPELLAPAESRQFIERLTEHYERGQWAASAEKIDKLLPGIVAFRMPIARLDAKFKMNQNRTAADRKLVVERLQASGSAEDAAVAKWIGIYDRDA
jgi:transcriptional regulator